MLSQAQSRALAKLADAWQDAYTLQETLPTLDRLVHLGLAEKRGASDLGALFSPRTAIHYRRPSRTGARVKG